MPPQSPHADAHFSQAPDAAVVRKPYPPAPVQRPSGHIEASTEGPSAAPMAKHRVR
jgi:hypothetical protein